MVTATRAQIDIDSPLVNKIGFAPGHQSERKTSALVRFSPSNEGSALLLLALTNCALHNMHPTEKINPQAVYTGVFTGTQYPRCPQFIAGGTCRVLRPQSINGHNREQVPWQIEN